jgi:predicted nucleotidyltransferase
MNKEIYTIDSTVRAEIQSELLRIAEDNNIRILYACESGSRGWGFSSPDSDYDVRFIFLHPTSWYLSVLPQDDGMDLFIDKELDINGWDIRKVLRLLIKSNATPFEWLQSPIVYQTDEDFKAALWSLSQHFFQARSSIHHYLGLSKNSFRKGVVNESEINIKKYFYVLRPLLAAMWIAEHKTAAPMTFADLMPALNPYPKIEEIVMDLWEQKLQLNEKDNIRMIPELNEFVHKEIVKCYSIADKIEETAVRTDMLDAFFRMVIQTYNGDY